MMFFLHILYQKHFKIPTFSTWEAWGGLQHPIGGLLNVPKSECTIVLLKVRSFNILVISWGFVIQCLKVPNHFVLGAFGGLHWSVGGLLRAPRGPTHSLRSLTYDFVMTSWRFVTFLLKITYSLCLGGLRGACQEPPRGPTLNQGPLYNSPIAIMI